MSVETPNSVSSPGAANNIVSAANRELPYPEGIYTSQNLTWQKVAIFGIALGSGLLLIALLGIIPAIGFTVTAILALSGIGIGLGFASSILLWQCKKNTRVENVINDVTLLETLRRIRVIYRESQPRELSEILELLSKISGQQQVILSGNAGDCDDVKELSQLSIDLNSVTKLIDHDDSNAAGEDLDTRITELNEEIKNISTFLKEYAVNVSKIAATILDIAGAKEAAAKLAEQAT